MRGDDTEKGGSSRRHGSRRPPPGSTCAAALPIESAVADLVVLFMVVTDVDDLVATIEEAFRVLVAGGRLCMAMGHPLQGIGDFSGDDRDGPYVIQRPYFESRRLTYWAERAGQRVGLNFTHRPLSAYTAALSSAGFLIESLTEPCPGHELDEHLSDFSQRRTIPSLLHLRAVKP